MVRRAVDLRDRRRAMLSLQSVSMALANYSATRGHLPPQVIRMKPESGLDEAAMSAQGGAPLYSWRVELVSYLQAWHGTWDPAHPWDHPANRELAELSSFYNFGAEEARDPQASFPETDILAITGPGTAFGDGQRAPMALKDIPPATILAVETQRSGIPWPAPGDFEIGTIPRTVGDRNGRGISSRTSGAFHLIFADGRVWLLSDSVPFATLSRFFTVSGAATHDREEVLGPYVLDRGP
jgi:hypothetical protein